MSESRIYSFFAVLVLFAALALFTGLAGAEASYAEEPAIYFDQETAEFTLSDYATGSLSVHCDGKVASWESSDESVIEITYGGYSTVYFNLVGVGTSVITAQAKDGSTASCTVVVDTPQIIPAEDAVTCNVSDSWPSFEITSGYGLSFRSLNEAVVRIDEDSSDSRCYLKPVAPGSAEVLITDCAGKTKTVTVTVTESEWSLAQTSIEGMLSERGMQIDIETEDWRNQFTAKSSNAKVVSVDNDYGYNTIGLYLRGVGTAEIRITDKYGKSASCTVKVKPDPISFGEYSVLKFDSYKTDDWEDHEIRFETEGESIIASVKTSNASVVKAVRDSFSDDDFFLKLTPVGAGTATVTATDQYKQTATMEVTVTQKYLDEMKYLEDMEDAFAEMYYGDTEAYFSFGTSAIKNTSIKATIGGKEYTAVSDGQYDYIIKKIPVLAAGTKISYTIQKGEAVYSGTSKILKGDLNLRGLLYLSKRSYVYSGKKIKPATSVEFEYNNWDKSKYLKKGTDYTVTYTNNLNVGTAKAKAMGKGNYGSSVTESFTILPKGTTISKVTKAKKAFTVKWKKQAAKMSKSRITGYQIRYSLKSSMAGAKTVTVKGYAKTSKTIKKLKAKKKYYVQVRTYKTVSKKNYYSAWSAKKTVKTK